MFKLTNITSTYGMKVYTDDGNLFGEVAEVIIENNKVFGWKVKALGEVPKSFGDIKGVIIPHQFVRAIGEIMIISKTAFPVQTEEEQEKE